jgi:hypothetical protein
MEIVRRWWGGKNNPRNQEVLTGIYCKNCHCRLSDVVKTRRVGDRIRRTRVCVSCGFKFFSWEQSE